MNIRDLCDACSIPVLVGETVEESGRLQVSLIRDERMMLGSPDYVSEDLFHLVGFRHPHDHDKNYEILKKILADGWLSHPPHEKNWGATTMVFNWNADLARGEFVIPTIICFADIPYDCLNLHAQKYGHFGLSIKRSALVLHHSRPVVYIPFGPSGDQAISGLTLLRHLQKVFTAFEFLVVKKMEEKPDIYIGSEPRTPDEAIEATARIFGKEFLAFVKPFDSTLPSNHAENYYMEREWRRFGNLELRAEYISQIVVHTDFVEKAKSELPRYQDLIVPSRAADDKKEDVTCRGVHEDQA